MNNSLSSIFELARQCLVEENLDHKIELSLKHCRLIDSGQYSLLGSDNIDQHIQPSLPKRPVLVSPEQLPKRGVGTVEGKAALLHAITHIEFNAIHLAWDAIYHFRTLPEQFYKDWAKVAEEETQHFLMLRNYLNQLGYDYGDFDAHDGLWQMAEKTKHDPMIRMALVPRVLEARGLDVTPQMIKRFQDMNDHQAVDILQIIYKEEITHVERGTRWFRYLCSEYNLDPEQTFKNLIDEYFDSCLRGPFNIEARMTAGFSEPELTWLESFAK